MRGLKFFWPKTYCGERFRDYYFLRDQQKECSKENMQKIQTFITKPNPDSIQIHLIQIVRIKIEQNNKLKRKIMQKGLTFAMRA